MGITRSRVRSRDVRILLSSSCRCVRFKKKKKRELKIDRRTMEFTYSPEQCLPEDQIYVVDYCVSFFFHRDNIL